MNNPVKEEYIVLGVSGSIAAYKAVEVASKLTKAGAFVDVVLTPAAEKLVSALTFRSVTGRKAFTDADLWGTEEHVVHITLARRADLLVMAPASANTLAKLAHGLGDNLLSVTALAAECPLMIAPAMDAGMFSHAATQVNVETLIGRGAAILGPAEGHLASGLLGKGRMVEPDEIVKAIQYHFSRKGPLKGKNILVTAGGTQESLDPVRFLTNHSSGKQGYALAQAALDRGANVTLITAPTSLIPPLGCTVINIQSAQEMHDAVLEQAGKMDAVIMAAAVADFRPAVFNDEKIKKTKKLNEIKLVSTIDILKEVGKRKKEKKSDLLLIGFAAESENLIKNATKKMEEKNLDLIVANDISRKDAGFRVDNNEVTIISKDGGKEVIPLQSKTEIAAKIIDILLGLMQDK